MNKFLIKYYALISALLLLTFTACDDDETPAEPPTISVSPEVSNADIGAIVDFDIEVTAGAGLASVSLNGTSIKSFSGETTGSFTHSYTMPAAEDQELAFSVEAQDGTSESTTIPVTFLSTSVILAPLEDAGTFAVVQKKDSWEETPSDKNSWTVDGGDHGDNTLIWVRDAGAGFADPWEFGATAPDGSKALALTRSADGLAGWGGWMTSFFDFGTGNPLPEEEVKAIQDGSRVIALDVYFEELDATHTFSAISAWETSGIDVVKETGGIKFQIRLGAEAFWGKDGANSFGDKEWLDKGVKEAYLTKAGEWQTLYFIDDDPGEGSIKINNVVADGVDRIFFVPNYAYPEIETNKMYIKNLRIVNAPQ